MADYRLTQSGDEVQNILDNAAMRSQVNQETERATGAENQLQQNINSNTQAIGTEETRAKGRENELQQLIQQVNASLINYYLKTETYSANQIDQMLAAIKQFRYQVVDVLPTPSADTMGIIYLVPSAHAVSGNIKDEYITLTRDEGAGIIYYFEQIGETAIDLSNYYTKAQTNAEISAAINQALAVYSTTAEMNTAIASAIATAIANYYTKAQTDSLIANFITASVNNLVNYYLKSETYTQAEVNALIAAVHQFTYQSLAVLPTASAETMNKIYLVPSTNPQTKNVKDEYITIATTDQGTTTYSWEQIGTTTVDLSGYSTTEQMNAAIANAIATALSNYYTKAQTMTSAEIEAAISAALASYSTTSEMNTAISNALNTALASYSTTSQMTAAIANAIANYYTKAEVDALIANFITASVNNLVNYYLKSETYTQTEVNQLIAAVQQFTYQSVAELPTASAETMNKIYLVPSTNPQTKNVKDEYITIAVTDQGTTTYSWEQIGTTTVDLSGYYTSAQTDAAISNALNTALASYSTTTQMTAAIATAIANYYTKAEVDALIANFITSSVNNLVNYYLKSETYTQAEVNALIAAVQQFTYQSVAELPTASAETMNKIYLVPSTNPQTKNVKDEFITIAVTDQGTTTYSWELIGTTDISLDNYYTKSQTDTAISAALNAALADYSTTSQIGTMISTAVTTALASYYNKTEIDAQMAQKQSVLTFDDTPTENSNNPVKSSGVYSANQTLYNNLHGEVQAVNARIDTLFNADYVGFSVRLSDTTKVMNMIGTAEQLAAFDDWVDNSPKPCEVKKDGTDFAYLTNTAGVASSTSWLTRADGTASKYSIQDKNYLQMVELENVNISIETTGTQLRVMFNFSPVCPEGFHRMFAEPTKLMSRYDLTFNSDGSTLDCCNGTSQPSGTFSFDNLHSMLNATGTDLLGWTAWEISCFAWIQAMRFRTLDVPSSARGKGLQSGSEAAARGWVNGATDSLTTPHGGVDQNGNGGYRFMYIENCTDGKQWLMGFGWHGNNGKGYFTRDDYKANAQALIPILECEVEHDYPTNMSETYAKNVSELGIATEGGGSASSGFFDGNWSNTSDDRIFYAGGHSNYGAVCGPFARNVIIAAAYAYWDLRGRVALRKSEVSA